MQAKRQWFRLLPVGFSTERQHLRCSLSDHCSRTDIPPVPLIFCIRRGPPKAIPLWLAPVRQLASTYEK
ncbi:hypothetical protein Peur_033718 [Populus x canadensis]